MRLYHTGYLEIRTPDIHFGRKNADFGQGFYLTDEGEFARRWARPQKDKDIILNTYELDLSGLAVHRFERDASWFEYIFRNRTGVFDTLPEADVIIGPIANDTIYDTFGIITSGILRKEDAMKLLLIGPVYRQIVIRTEKAVRQLTWLSAEILDREEAGRYRDIGAEEEAAYQAEFARVMETL